MELLWAVGWMLVAAAHGYLPDVLIGNKNHHHPSMIQVPPLNSIYLDPHLGREYFLQFKKLYHKRYRIKKEENERFHIFLQNLQQNNRKNKVFPKIFHGIDKDSDRVYIEITPGQRPRLRHGWTLPEGRYPRPVIYSLGHRE